MSWTRLNEVLATWFYLGKIPKAPGTWGTLGALPLVFLGQQFSPLVYMASTIVFCFFAVFVASAHEAKLGVHDSKEIVIDEVAGFLIAMTWLPATWQAYLAAFVVFRILDILKPFPIGMLDKKIQGGLGVVADDIAAGILANIILQMIYTNTAWLGLQYLE